LQSISPGIAFEGYFAQYGTTAARKPANHEERHGNTKIFAAFSDFGKAVPVA
jgi:hypothetical protein